MANREIEAKLAEKLGLKTALGHICAKNRTEAELIAECLRLVAEREQLFDALELLVWQPRADFPNDPYCHFCGAGRRWSLMHGHEKNCIFAGREIVLPTDGGKE